MGKAIKKPLSEEQKKELALEKAEEKRREELGIQDEFQAQGRAWAERLEDHQGLTFAGLGLFLAAGIGVSMMNSSAQSAQLDQNIKLETYLEAEGDTTTQAPSLDDPDLQSLATLVEAGRLLSSGEFDAASQKYRPLLSKEGLVSMQAYDGLSAALFQKGDKDEALKLTNEWVTKADGGLATALMRSSEYALALGKKEAALKSAGRVLAEFQDVSHLKKRAESVYNLLGEPLPEQEATEQGADDVLNS